MIGYLDCCSGLSGDMLLGALVDAGLPATSLTAATEALGLGGEVRIRAEVVSRSGLRATRVHVDTRDDQGHRTLPAITELVQAAPLTDLVRASSIRVLTRLAEAEAAVHGVPAEEVELHEVGSLDAIVDVVGSVAGLVELGITELYASAMPVSSGAPLEGAHGPLPVPAPATLALLATARAPTRPFGDGRELVTPTGAALAATLARFEQPPLRLDRVGCGAGAAELPWPNVLRLWVGTALEGETARAGHVVLQTNLDDMSPELLAPATGALLAAGALDVAVSPLLMKKGRAGWLVSVIGHLADEAALAEVLLRETTTLGVRVHDVRRYEAGRRQATVVTAFGPVEVKLKLLGGAVVSASPEFESVVEAAAAAHAPPAAVHAAAAAAAQSLLGPDGAGETVG